ncbi:transcription elongation factor GreA [Patescibacteria group bacterium]|nr:transcription elongation factor GreA [Patescibacteria group bacterium]
MAEKIYITKQGYEDLKSELERLLGEERKAISERIRTAKEHGDLSENSEYSDAKEQQSFVEGRIIELEHIIKNAEIIEDNHNDCSLVGLGCTVHLSSNVADLKYKIVGSVEANPEKGFISNESPIGKALLGKKQGEEVEVSVPAGVTKYKIKKIN